MFSTIPVLDVNSDKHKFFFFLNQQKIAQKRRKICNVFEKAIYMK